jgi:hypothetical protein
MPNLELLALEDVPIRAAGLTRARRNARVETASAELRLEEGVNLGLLLALLDLALDVVRLLLLLGVGVCGSRSSSRSRLGALLGDGLSILYNTVRADYDGSKMSGAYVGLVPLAEGGSIDLDDGALNEGVRPDELVVGRVVNLMKMAINNPYPSKPIANIRRR